jgi:hypothetical protein
MEILNNKRRLSLYFKLIGKSCLRLFNEFSLALKLFFVLLLVAGGYLLAGLPFTASIRNYAIVFVVFFLLGQWVCRISPSEKDLLVFLKIPVVWICAIKCLVLSAPFFLLDIWSGLLVMIFGTPAVVFYPGVVVGNIRIVSFYVRSSYQWLGMYRRTGVWVLSAGFILLLIGLWHRNVNMACFCLGCIIILPCFFAYYGQPDPKPFLSVYKSSRILLRKKVGELLANISIPALVCVICLLIFDFAHTGLYLKFILLFLYADLLMFYFCYLCYPHVLTACVLFAVTVCMSAGLFFSYPLIALPALLLLVLLHILTIVNLKSVIAYGKAESAD